MTMTVHAPVLSVAPQQSPANPHRRAEVPNARFWVYWSGTWSKLTLAPGQEVSIGRWSRHEEGWSSESETYEYDAFDNRIVQTRITDGVDCDGRLSTTDELVCPIAELQSEPLWMGDFDPEWPDGMRPDHGPVTFQKPTWRSRRSSQHDQFAEAAGY